MAVYGILKNPIPIIHHNSTVRGGDTIQLKSPVVIAVVDNGQGRGCAGWDENQIWSEMLPHGTLISK